MSCERKWVICVLHGNRDRQLACRIVLIDFTTDALTNSVGRVFKKWTAWTLNACWRRQVLLIGLAAFNCAGCSDEARLHNEVVYFDFFTYSPPSPIVCNIKGFWEFPPGTSFPSLFPVKGEEVSALTYFPTYHILTHWAVNPFTLYFAWT